MKKILYVEDLKDAIRLVEYFCKNIYEIDSAMDVESAIEKVKNNSYDLILMDINLRQPMDGIMLSKYLKKENLFVNKPIIAVTAYNMPDETSSLNAAGFDAIINKPIIKDVMLTKLAEFL